MIIKILLFKIIKRNKIKISIKLLKNNKTKIKIILIIIYQIQLMWIIQTNKINKIWIKMI